MENTLKKITRDVIYAYLRGPVKKSGEHTCLTNCRSRTSRDLLSEDESSSDSLMEDGIRKLYKVGVDVTTRDFVIDIRYIR